MGLFSRKSNKDISKEISALKKRRNLEEERTKLLKEQRNLKYAKAIKVGSVAAKGVAIGLSYAARAGANLNKKSHGYAINPPSTPTFRNTSSGKKKYYF